MTTVSFLQLMNPVAAARDAELGGDGFGDGRFFGNEELHEELREGPAALRTIGAVYRPLRAKRTGSAQSRSEGAGRTGRHCMEARKV